jgi:hypothetical protein
MRFIADESCDAVGEQRVLLTEDKDFGQLVFASRRPAAGVVFIRFPAGARARLAAEVLAFVQANQATLADSFSTLQPGRARISRLPA